jgi:hypothetical protein
VFELAYDVFSEIVYLVSVVKAFRGKRTEWKET